jgi:hypothetical protein
VILPNFANFLTLANAFLGGYAMQLHACILREGGWDAGVGRSRAPSSQTVGNLLRKPRPAKPDRKKLAKSEFGEFTSTDKYTRQLLIERIRWERES